MTFPDNVPVIETEDLILRGYKQEDFEPFVTFCASERSRFAGGPLERPLAWRAFMGAIGHWVFRGYGMWVLEHRATGQVAGRVGILMNDGWDEPELGWHIYDGFESKGLAYQASVACRDHAARHMGLDGVISYIDPANARSVRLAERLGAAFERDGEVNGQPCQVWRHPRIAEAGA
jgi:RimJ/RimL family protein N-acetyltransferase